MYWPDVVGEEKEYCRFGVTLTDCEQTADFVVRTFQVRCDDAVRHVKHFHYTAWPDHGVPNHTAPIISFRRKVRQYDDSHPGPLIVHCRLQALLYGLSALLFHVFVQVFDELW